MLLAPVLVRLTAPRKSLAALSSRITPAPAFTVMVPAPIVIPPVCVIAPLLVRLRLPVTSGLMFTAESVSAFMSRIEMAFTPLLVRLTAPPKSLPALLSAIAPAPALSDDCPLPVTIAPVCVIAPLVVTARTPAAVGVIDTPPSASAPTSRIVMALAPVLLRLTAPRKSLPTLFSVIAAAPAANVTAPLPLRMAVVEVCVMAPLLVIWSVPAAELSIETLPSVSAFWSRIEMAFAPVVSRVIAPPKSLLGSLSAIGLFAVKVAVPELRMPPAACVSAPFETNVMLRSDPVVSDGIW